MASFGSSSPLSANMSPVVLRDIYCSGQSASTNTISQRLDFGLRERVSCSVIGGLTLSGCLMMFTFSLTARAKA
eukprot:2770407-Heterocapsa_arctica.AAC.1